MGPTAYTHSEVFAKLKNTKEELDQNYTTFQLLGTLDYFIEAAIDPIVTAFPDLTDVFFAKVIAYQFDNPNTKCSRNDKLKLPVMLFNSVTSVGKKKREHQKKMLLNRGLLFGLVSVFLKTVNTYRKLHNPHIRLRREARMLGFNLAEQRVGSSFLYAAILQSEFYIGKAHHFKEVIVQKYTRLSIMQAKKTYQEIEYQKSLDDIIQIYLIYLSKAIDRCDSRQGVLAQYIKSWFYSARSEIMKSVARDSLNTSYDQLLEIGVNTKSVDPDQTYEAEQFLCATARKLDPSGAFRFATYIPEFYSSKDLRKLSLFITDGDI
jgi:hypothetical protein